MFASFQKKYFLSDKGVAGVKRGIFWTAITNLVTMAGMGFLFLTMACFVEHLTTGAALPAAGSAQAANKVRNRLLPILI